MTAALFARLGDIDLLEPVAAGGMGEVWRGTLRGTGGPVAVKLLHPDRGTPARVARFESELRRTARLNHPHIVDVIDFGALDAANAAILQRTAGQPWYAMEWLPRDLASAPLPDVRAGLGQLLSALAHAHAHGLVHQDIKPANLLLTPRGDLRVADFGVASGRGEHDRHGGTLSTMAPEQLSGAPLGPWTDLYAVGCVAWWLLTGAPPVQTADPAQALWARMHFEAPPTPQWDPALRAWLLSLLAPDPASRPQHAAEALRALEAVPSWPAAVTPLSDEPSVSVELPVSPTTAPASPAPRRALLLGPAPAPYSRPRPGLRLWGLRDVPLVGRRDDIESLWEDARAALGGQTGATVVHGPPGVGKSRLTRWLATRLSERGAVVLELAHEERGTLQGALARALEAAPWGLPSPLPGPLRDLVAGRPVDPADIERALLTAVRRAARPVVLLLDDLHWGANSQELVRRLLARPDAPVWVLATWVGCPELPGVRLHPLAPLPPERLQELATSQLGTDPAAAALLVQRAGGNPLFATQILSSWIREGRLGAGGFVAPDPDAIPSDLLELLVARLEPWREGHAWGALTLAAALGRQVRQDEWVEACAEQGLPNPSTELDGLARHGLAEPAHAGWRFSHGLFREAILRVAGEQGRDAHRVCARVLERRLPADLPSSAARVAAHLEQAGDTGPAREAWWRSLELTQGTGPSRPDAERAARKVLALDPPPAQAGWARFRLIRIEAVRTRRTDAAALEALIEDATARGDGSLRRNAQMIEVWAAHWAGQVELARDLSLALVEDARRAGDKEMLSATLSRLGGIWEHLGDSARCTEALVEALEYALPGPKLANSLSRLAEHRHAHGMADEALRLALEADAEYARTERQSLPRYVNRLVLAELARGRGDWEEAKGRASSVLQELEEFGLGPENVTYQLAQLCMALSSLGAGPDPAAEATLAFLRDTWTTSKPSYALIPRVHLVRLAAWRGDWEPARALFGVDPPNFLPDPDIVVALVELEAAAPPDLAPVIHAWGAPWRAWQGSVTTPAR